MRKFEKIVYPLPCEFSDKAYKLYSDSFSDYSITKNVLKGTYNLYLYIGGDCVYQDKTMEEINEYLEDVYDDLQEQIKELSEKYGYVDVTKIK